MSGYILNSKSIQAWNCMSFSMDSAFNEAQHKEMRSWPPENVHLTSTDPPRKKKDLGVCKQVDKYKLTWDCQCVLCNVHKSWIGMDVLLPPKQWIILYATLHSPKILSQLLLRAFPTYIQEKILVPQGCQDRWDHLMCSHIQREQEVCQNQWE